jgi:SAM-dependent methyltransferase
LLALTEAGSDAFHGAMEDETERLVAAGYDVAADAYAGLEGATPWPREEWLGELLARLPGGSRVLDLGCGAGVPAARLLVDRGHAVLGVDVSEEQLRRARANVPRTRFRMTLRRPGAIAECEARTQRAFVAGGYGRDRGRRIAPASAAGRHKASF